MTDFSQEALEIASALGGLTYVIGALIYALPIPFRGLKDWGPTLMGDGIYVAFWTAFYSAIEGLMSTVETDLGVTWKHFLSFIDSNLSTVALLFITVSTASALLQKFFINYAPLTMLSLGLSTLTLVLVAVKTLGYLVKENWSILVVIGIMLMAIPFRIARSAGATLISFSITFYTGLPVMVDFLNLIQFSLPNNSIIDKLNPAYPIIHTMPTIFAIILSIMAYIGILTAIAADLADTIGGYRGRLPFGIEVVL